MNVTRRISELHQQLSAMKNGNRSIGLVPTMGFLHEGHLELVRASMSQNDHTVVTSFVNPLQFNNASDLTNYPVNASRDIELLKALGVDLLFMPEVSEMYEKKPIVKITFGDLGNKLEGKFRPGHFDGVGIIVSKLFHLIAPNRAYFGLKDFQQYRLIDQMTTDLSFPIEIIPVPTQREANGLAMSSRNVRLSEAGKEIASNIFKGLNIAKISVEKKLTLEQIKGELITFYDTVDGLDLEYAEVVDPDTFEELETYTPGMAVAICVAAYVEGVRLIDNLYLQPESHK